jgi:hypothetical protein
MEDAFDDYLREKLEEVFPELRNADEPINGADAVDKIVELWRSVGGKTRQEEE